MSFARVLRDVMEADDGLVLHLAAFEHMVGQREKPRGWTGRFFDVLFKRSRKIIVFVARLGRILEKE